MAETGIDEQELKKLEKSSDQADRDFAANIRKAQGMSVAESPLDKVPELPTTVDTTAAPTTKAARHDSQLSHEG